MMFFYAPQAHRIITSTGAVRYYCTACRFTTAPCRHYIRS